MKSLEGRQAVLLLETSSQFQAQMATTPRSIQSEPFTLEQACAWLAEQNDPVIKTRPVFIFGAGLSIALSTGIQGGKATWSGLMRQLNEDIKDKFKKKFRQAAGAQAAPGGISADWAVDEALAHRVHTINSLTYGDSDAVLASTFLLDRIHGLYCGDGNDPHWPPMARHQDVNAVAYAIEEQFLSNYHNDVIASWTNVLQSAGGLARDGKLRLATTNFDHTLAMAAGLPVFLAPHIPRKDDIDPCPYEEGLVIPQESLHEQKQTIWGGAQIKRARRYVPGPVSFQSQWRNPHQIPNAWWRQIASVFHVHGSRLVPESMVFDPISYSQMTAGGKNQAGRLMGTSFFERSDPIVFIGCGGTILDVHFARYWKLRKSEKQRVLVVAKADEADLLLRQVHSGYFALPPQICSYEGGHDDLPNEVGKMLEAIS